jgi:hypothetical protein
LKRAYQEAGSDSVQLRALSTPGDELIDLGDKFQSGAAKIEDLLPEGQERESEIALRRRYRPAERALLVIHPLNWKQTFDGGKKFSLSEPLSARGPVFGITFVFPFSKRDQSRFGFVSNKTVNEPRPVQLYEVKKPPAVKQEPLVAPTPPLPLPVPHVGTWKLSKSQYVKGRKCLKRVWLYNHHRELADDPTEMQRLLFSQGNEVGQLAHKYFERGHLIHEDYLHSEDALKHTEAALKNRDFEAVFEAAFIFDNVLIRVDVIRKNDDGSLDLIEVKSTNSVKKEHKDDVAVQKYVLESLGHEVRASYLMHLNGDYILSGHLDIKELFVLEPMDEEIEDHLGDVPNYLKLIRSKLNDEVEPQSPIGSVCKNPYPCEFQSHCWKSVGGDSIHKLVRITDKKRAELSDMGAQVLKDVPDSFELTEAQTIQVKVSKSGKVHVENVNIRNHLSTLKWPLHFLVLFH